MSLDLRKWLTTVELVHAMREKLPVWERRLVDFPQEEVDSRAVLENVRSDHTKMEGPFGEWTGYYASKERGAPVVDVERLYFRNDPIILGAPPNCPPNDSTTFQVIKNSAMLWNALDKSGVPDVRGVWMSDVGQQQLGGPFEPVTVAPWG